MEPGLKARMLDAAAVADKLWQHNVAKALTDGIAEIERLLSLLADVQQVQCTTVRNMETLLPFLRRLENPTQEMRAAMEGETPYNWRRNMDKTAYEVYFLDYPDWRDVVAEPQRIVFESKDREAVETHCAELQFAWRYSEMLRVAAEQPLNLTDGKPA